MIVYVYYTISITNLGPGISVCILYGQLYVQLMLETGTALKDESNRLCCCERYLQAVVHFVLLMNGH